MKVTDEANAQACRMSVLSAFYLDIVQMLVYIESHLNGLRCALAAACEEFCGEVAEWLKATVC